MSITLLAFATAAKSLQSCPTLCDPIDGSPPGSPVLGFSRQEHWSGLPFPSPGDLPNQGIKPESPALQGRFFTIEPPGNIHYMVVTTISLIVSTFFSCSSKKMSGCYTQVISATGPLLLMSSSSLLFILSSFFLSDPLFRSQLSSHLNHSMKPEVELLGCCCG